MKIKNSTLLKSVKYLACPKDFGSLMLFTEIGEETSNGEYRCQDCNTTYPIRDGVPYFFEVGNGFEWNLSISDKEIITTLNEDIGINDLTWAKIVSLGPFLQKRSNDRKQAIDKLFNIIEAVVRDADINEDIASYLTQAATTSRYDIEVYRGTFKLPQKIVNTIGQNLNDDLGLIVEGACATGDCLNELTDSLNGKFYLGLDISGSQVREAQEKAGNNELYVQGNITQLPVKTNKSGSYILNNVFDRVVDPGKASKEADRILKSNSSFLALSNCDPLQFEYKTEDGLSVVWVPEKNRLSLEEGLKKAGFELIAKEKGDWYVQTVAYGKEVLPFKSLVGGR